ncbi:MAG: hypothetical protein LBJ61_08745 [Deltaproteobacteria bacterium]|nr:hypothetical protein [Deltaproteobacteria bacterium]
MKKKSMTLPEVKFYFRRSGQRLLVYLTTGTREGDKLIGYLDQDSQLVPNDEYYRLFGKPTANALAKMFQPNIKSTQSIGVWFAIHQIFVQLGVEEALKAAFKSQEQIDEIMGVAAFMAYYGNDMSDFRARVKDFWPLESMSDHSASTFFASIDEKAQKRFFEAWLANNDDDETICYLVASRSDESNFSAPKRDVYGDIIPRLKLSCYYSRKSGRPLFYHTNWGPLSGKWPPAKPLVQSARTFPGAVTFVAMGGKDMKPITRQLHQGGHRYVVGMGGSEDLAFVAIDKVRESIISSRRCLGEGKYATSTDISFEGVNTQARVCLDLQKGEELKANLASGAKYETEQFNWYAEKGGDKFADKSPYQIAVTQENGKILYELNHDKLDAVGLYYGYLCALSNAPFEDAEFFDILIRYDLPVKAFYDIGSRFDGDFTGYDKRGTTSGKLFCAFLSLIITTRMEEALTNINKYGPHKILDERELFRELEMIQVAELFDGRSVWSVMTDLGWDIFSALELKEENLADYAGIPSRNQIGERWNGW